MHLNNIKINIDNDCTMKDADIRCPRCGSSNIHTDKKGFKVGRSLLGGLLTGNLLVAGISGAVGMNKIQHTCLGCGHKFNIGDGLTSKIVECDKDWKQTLEECRISAEKYRDTNKRAEEWMQSKEDNRKKANLLKICPSCGFGNSFYAKYCSSCSTELNNCETIEGKNRFEFQKCNNCNMLTYKASRKNKYCIHCKHEL